MTISCPRFGSEKFVLLLPGGDPTAIRLLVKRLRMLVGASGIDLSSGQELSVTMSMAGVLATAQDDVEGLLHRAGQLAYQRWHEQHGSDGAAAFGEGGRPSVSNDIG